MGFFLWVDAEDVDIEEARAGHDVAKKRLPGEDRSSRLSIGVRRPTYHRPRLRSYTVLTKPRFAQEIQYIEYRTSGGRCFAKLKSWKHMSETKELTEADLEKARQFVQYLLLHAGPLIDEMQLTRNQAELAFAWLLGDSLSYRDKALRPILAAQWHEVVIDAAERLEAKRIQRTKPGEA